MTFFKIIYLSVSLSIIFLYTCIAAYAYMYITLINIKEAINMGVSGDMGEARGKESGRGWRETVEGEVI